MRFGISLFRQTGLDQTAEQEYRDFAQKNVNHATLAEAAKHRNAAQQWMKKGGPAGQAQAQAHLTQATLIEKQAVADYNRAYIAQSINKLNERWSNGYGGDDAWAQASFQARMKASFADFRSTGGDAAEFQQRVLGGIQNPYFRSALLGHPGLA